MSRRRNRTPTHVAIPVDFIRDEHGNAVTVQRFTSVQSIHVPAVIPGRGWAIGVAIEDIRAGDRVEIEPETGRLRRVRT